MAVNCQDHRTTMLLLSLKRKLEKGISDPHEEEEVRKMIQKLEEQLQID